MKMQKEHFEHIKTEVCKIPLETRQQHWQELAKDPKVKNIHTRFVWDCFNAAKLTAYACDVLYPAGLHDNHIETALKRIFPNK
jgi:hypothetical protein